MNISNNNRIFSIIVYILTRSTGVCVIFTYVGTSKASLNLNKYCSKAAAIFWQPPGGLDGCDKPRHQVRAADMKWFSMLKPSVTTDASVSACRIAVMEEDLMRRRSLFETLRGSSLRIVTIR
jgi:hypothetical protein